MTHIKFIHIDEARKHTGHSTRRAFNAWFRRARNRHPEINVLYRQLYVEEAAFHLLNAADTTATASAAPPIARKTNIMPANPQHPGMRPIRLPLTRQLTSHTKD